MTLTLVAEEPEDNKWVNEEITWEASIMHDLDYATTSAEWEDFKDYMCEHARAWMEAQHDKLYHAE